ncbi:MAG: ankyrin repeat domain-containing protein [candidate division Zixibacteria bacterium]|nr:ankyrin repeat domain-containing protein [candidate division Zixibacteria bacterium]
MPSSIHVFLLSLLLVSVSFSAALSTTPDDDLIASAKTGDLAGVKNAIARGADVALADKDGATAMTWATINGHLPVVQYLAENGADVNGRDTQWGQTVLMYACWSGHIAIARYLVGQGADVNMKSTGGNTPLSVAFSHGHRSVALFLIDAGASPDVPGQDGEILLMGAIVARDWDIAKHVLEKGCNVNAADNSGKTVLMYAADIGVLDIGTGLVEKGAHLNARDSTGRTALMYAAQAYVGSRFTESSPTDSTVKVRIDHVGLVEYLISEGADPTVADNRRKTALDYARAARRLDNEMVVALESTKMVRPEEQKPFQVEGVVTSHDADTGEVQIKNNKTEHQAQEPAPPDQSIPLTEQSLVQRIRTEGVSDRFVIHGLKPKEFGPAAGTFTLDQQDANTLVFYREFSDDYVVIHGVGGPMRPQLDIGEGFGQRTFGEGGATDELPFAYGTICRFKGTATLAGYCFAIQPDGGNRLSFAFMEHVGFVHLQGTGMVTMRDGKEVRLGY